MDTAEIDRELDDVEAKIDRLRSLYEQYFLGIEKMEPSIPRRDVERKFTILRKEQIRNTAQRFKFQMLVQRYNTMQQHWARVTREIENGTYRRDVARAAARFGEKEALTILGKRKQKQYAVLAEAQLAARNKRRGVAADDELELSDSDLLVDDEDDDDDVPTGSKPRAPISAEDPGSSERKGQLGGLRWTGKSSGDPASAVRSTEAQTGVKRRLAELAAAMKLPVPTSSDDPATPPPRAQSPSAIASGVRSEAPAFGSLDLDLDESAASQRSALLRKPAATSTPITTAAIPASTGSRPLPPAVRPPPPRPPTSSDPGGPRTPAPFSPRTPAPLSPQAPRPAGSDFGALDLPFDAPPPLAPPPRALPPPVAPPPRATPPAAPRPIAAPPRAPAAPPAATSRPATAPAVAQFSSVASAATPAIPPARPSAPAARPSAPTGAPEGALPDQRLRQIYAKYVEAKRSANESTAGVTYEKLAETLRAQADRLKATHPAKSVDYDVVIKDGKALLKPVLR